MKICFIVHRYPPYPGGSEYYVQAMAEETLSRNHSVTVITDMHQGNQNGILVTSNRNLLFEEFFDLIIVHGAHGIPPQYQLPIQDFVLLNSNQIKSKILYMIILPKESESSLFGLKHCDFIGCSTIEDWNFIEQLGFKHKSFEIRHGIDPKTSLKKNSFRSLLGIEKNELMLLSCGGFWPHKGFEELANIFIESNIEAKLVLTGYDVSRIGNIQNHENIKIVHIEDKQKVIDAIADADYYILNSYEEGFGLVLLESSLNKTKWISRNIAGAKLLNKRGLGKTYETKKELIEILKNLNNINIDINYCYEYVLKNHLIKNTIDDILSLIGG